MLLRQIPDTNVRFLFEMLFSTHPTYLVVGEISQIKLVAQIYYFIIPKEKHISIRRNVISTLMKLGYQFSALIEFS